MVSNYFITTLMECGLESSLISSGGLKIVAIERSLSDN